MTPEKAFRLYIATRLHFTTQYDVFQSQGKLSWIPNESNRRDFTRIIPFIKEVKTERALIELTAANMLYGHKDFLYAEPEEGIDNYSHWNMVKQSFDHVLDRDLSWIGTQIDSGKCQSLEGFLQKRFISAVLSRHVQYESIIMINRHIPIYHMIDGFDAPKYIDRMVKANLFVKKGTLAIKHSSRIDDFFSNYKLKEVNHDNTIRTSQIPCFDV